MADESEEMRSSYDFSKARRGEYASRYAAGSNVIVLDPDIAKAFRDEKPVNDALRKLLVDSEGR
jgi:hypothetical protein